MAKPWFFFSYSGADRKNSKFGDVNFLEDLFRDLEQDIALKRPVGADPVGFFNLDPDGIAIGKKWQPELMDALSNCRTIVCLCSRNYFDSENCGKEVQVFLERQRAHVAQNGGNVPPVVIPIFWDVPDNLKLPDSIKDFHNVGNAFPAEYVSRGLLSLRRLNFATEYQQFRIALANILIHGAEDYTLPSPAQILPYEQVASAFAAPAPVGAAPAPQESGPRYAEFVYVAGRKQDLQAIRQKVDFYGDDGGSDWRPYLPDLADEIELLAQSAATEVKLRYRVLDVDPTLPQKVDREIRNRKIVVLLVDSWTVRLPQYRQYLNGLDTPNTVVLVPHNTSDQEAAAEKPNLDLAVDLTFSTKKLIGDPAFYRTSIPSGTDLKEALIYSLVKAKDRILENERVARLAASNNVFLTAPVIHGPGGVR